MSIKLFSIHTLVDYIQNVVKAYSSESNVVVYRIPREKISKTVFDGEESLNRGGIYFLIKDNTVRVGKGDIYDRLMNHVRSSNPAISFFEYVIVITSDEGLNPTSQSYLEHSWVKKLKENNSYYVTNENTPSLSPTAIHDKIAAEKILEFAEACILLLCNKNLSIILQKTELSNNPATVKTVSVDLSNVIFECHSSFAHGMATMFTNGETKILKGSKLRLNPTPSFLDRKERSGINAFRNNLIQQNKVNVEDGGLILKDDLIVSSPSFASTLVLGNGSNGLVDWKNNGKTLKSMGYEGYITRPTNNH